MSTKGRRRRTKLEIARDRAEIERLRLRYRMPPLQIVEKIAEFYQDEDEDKRPTVGFEQVKKEIKAATEDYQNLENLEIKQKRQELIRQFYDLAIQCQEQYDKSLADRVTKVTEGRSNKEKGDSTLTRETTVNTDGNARYLEIKLHCLKFIAELEATIPPKKIAPTNPDGTDAFKFEGAEELKRLAALAREAGALLPSAKK